MIKTGHLGRYELLALVVILAIADIFLNFPQQLVRMGGSAGWMIPLVSMGICLIVWMLIGPVLARQRTGNLLFLARSRFGRWGTGAASLLVALFLVLDTANTVRMFTETVITEILPRSPISFVIAPLMVVLVYYAYTGIEGLSRVALVLTPWLLIAITLLLAFNGNWMNLDYILPLWGRGVPALLFSGGIVTGIFTNILLLAIFASLLRNPADSLKIGFWSILIVGLVYSIVTLVFLLVFPSEAAVRVPIPLYQLGRLIYVGRFFQRLEAGFAFFWIAAAVIKIAVSLWTSSYLIASVFRMPVNRPLVFPIALIVYSLSFVPQSFTETLELNMNYRLRWGWIIVIGLPMLLLLWMRDRTRKEGKGDESDSPQTS
ncbi:GerAB/ArcD/ProY family transporter [Effusibacillus dendaii]|uniref:Germination protein n=1 Tax=Effusibacillus dendaii TaxID=2743772 RepID=A0A7I8D9Y6_9BACL|nr:GerAB/ArcD/ProY family transporter [Effusibacillus dendaii]BCJ86978.1 germination protein [Effusibacillus dendaii]